MTIRDSLLALFGFMAFLAVLFAGSAMFGWTPWLWVITGPLIIVTCLFAATFAMIVMDDFIVGRRKRRRTDGKSV